MLVSPIITISKIFGKTLFAVLWTVKEKLSQNGQKTVYKRLVSEGKVAHGKQKTNCMKYPFTRRIPKL